ncbi:MAG: hypothetical protein V2J08_15690 [Desulfotignum sp.]|jgi:hypothetical protein|nr:hypothetical protein [Desulfotignum sp.]
MKYTWWILQIVLMLISLFFLFFGVNLLRASYGLDDPFSFIMTFFAASFVLLISTALVLTFVIKMVRVFKRIQKPQ